MSGTAADTAPGTAGPRLGGATDTAPAPPGWHGKLPSLGDFASRRLPPDFVSPWDHWLASGLQQLRERDPTGWLDAYLASPSRRFLLMPGVLPGAAGQQAWAGVLMPSVDRVGRYFPFTIVQPTALPATPEQTQSLWGWLGRLDELAADALHDDWSVDQLEAELARMAGPDLAPLAAPSATSPAATPAATPAAQPLPLSPGACVALALAPGLDISRQIGIDAQALWLRHAWGQAYWYANADLQAPSLFVSKGLPASAADLLGATM